MSKSNASFKILFKGSKTPSKINDEQSLGNTTNNDSLHNTKKSILKSFRTENKTNEKKNNFFMALKSLQSSINYNFNTITEINENDLFQGINEYSESNINQTKEENISKYIHRPLVKKVIKEGNNLNIIQPLTQFGTSINNPYVFNYNLGDIIHKFRPIQTEINVNDNYVNKFMNVNTVTVINKNKYKKIFGDKNNSKIKKLKDDYIISTNVKPAKIKKIIEDLEKPVEIKIKTIDNKNTNNSFEKTQEQKIDNDIINNSFICNKSNKQMKQNMANKYQLNKDKLKSLVKNLNFQDISKEEKNTDKNIDNYNDKENKIWQNENAKEKDSKSMSKIKKMLISKINTATGEKIKKKYERSELKKKRMLQQSENINNKNIINLIMNENKENNNNNNNNIELTKKIIKKINEMTTIKADYNDNKIIDMNNNLLYNFYKRKENFYCSSKSKNVVKNLLNIFNSCSKKYYYDGPSIDGQSIKNINNLNNSSFQEILDLFSDKSILTNKDKDNNTIIIKDIENKFKLNSMKDFNSLFESSGNSKSTNKNISNKFSSNLSEQKMNSEKIGKNQNNKKTNILYYSPINQKMRYFDLDSPFNSPLISIENTFIDFTQTFGTDIKLKNFQRSQEIMNKIIKNNFHGGLLELSESPSLINTLSPNSFAKPFYKLNYIIDANNNKAMGENIEINFHSNSKNKFSLEDSQIPNTIYDISFYLNLINQSSSYPTLNQKKIFHKNPKIKWNDRLKTLLWMMKNCEEFAYKRDTFHYALYYFDAFLFLSKEKINQKDLKLIGITCISLSAKIEEIQIPKLSEYAKSIEPKNIDLYINLIISMEQKICSTLKWKLIPITTEIWLNWYICQWDLYIDSSPEIKKELMKYIKEDDIIYFKRQNEKAYSNYRRIYQLIDLISLDYNNYSYDKRGIIAGCFFECITFEYNLEYSFDKKKLWSKKKDNKLPFIILVQKMYNLFLEQSFDFLFNDKLIQKSIKYVLQFSKFSFSYNMPLIYKAGQKLEEDIENNYEDFISYQTTNSEIYSFFEKMYKKEEKKGNKIKKDMKNAMINIRK